jgi:hypothetical protein
MLQNYFISTDQPNERLNAKIPVFRLNLQKLKVKWYNLPREVDLSLLTHNHCYLLFNSIPSQYSQFPFRKENHICENILFLQLQLH